MKFLLKITGVLTLLTFFMVCCAPSQFENTTPFSIKKAIYNVNDSFYNLQIESDQNITPNPTIVYFRDKFSEYIKADGNQLKILIPRKSSHHMVLHKDSEKEFGNTLQNNNKFILNENEIVLGFEQKGVTKYYKIIGTKQ
ncbi:MAG: hypothetical protein ACK5HU_06540 [Flavobacteriales bacterium]